MGNVIIKAAQFSRIAHDGQFRKYTGAPFYTHPARVAGRVAAHPEANEIMVVAAFLHDIVEDTDYTFDDICDTFGVDVSDLVSDLTDPTREVLGDAYSKTPRTKRKEHARVWYSGSNHEAKIIKLIDRIDNLREMPLYETNSFFLIYLLESRELAEAIGDADPILKEELLNICNQI